MSRFGFGFVSGRNGNDQFTKSLLHFDGTSGSTTITDTAFGKSPVLAWTAVACSLSTAAQKFGSASLANASSEYITTPDDAAFNALGTTPFVFDCWINTSNSGTLMFIAGIGYRSAVFSFFLSRDAANTLTFNANGATVTTAGTVSSAGWHHVACIADGSKIYIALDGTVSAGVAYSALSATAGPFDIGSVHFSSAPSLSISFAGNIDEARLSVGTTRGWTSNFSVPTSAYS